MNPSRTRLTMIKRKGGRRHLAGFVPSGRGGARGDSVRAREAVDSIVRPKVCQSLAGWRSGERETSGDGEEEKVCQ